MKIGFVGLGIMGKPMAKNLLKAGYELAVFDLNKEAVAEVAEAMQMGQMCGVEPEKIFEAIRGGLAGSTVMYAKAPMMMDQNFKPGFRIDLHIKDLNNVVDAAKAVDAPIPLTQSVLEMMKILHKDGDGGCDHSALLKYYQKLTGEVLHH